MNHIAVITKNHTNPAYGGALVGARHVASLHGLEIRHSAPTIPDDVQQQCDLVRSALTSRPSAIVLLPVHATGVNAAIREVNEARVPLFMFVSEPTEGRWITYVGTDSQRMAYDLALRLLASLPTDAHVAIVDGHPGSITTPERHLGFEQALCRYPSMRMVGSICGQYQEAPARDAMRSLLKHQARLDGVLVANDLMAIGVLQALDEADRRAAIVSINGTPDAIRQVRLGRLVATASFNTHRFGCLSVEAAARHLRGEKVPGRIVLPADIVQASNAAEWDVPYESRIPPDWATTVAAHTA